VAAGAALRFWGLGTLSLFGDEDVMSLATRALVEAGSPILPSGMYYVRALPQLYMMAASTSIFGDTEWALRLPSALIGTLGIGVAFWLARRFLSVNWALFFALVFALLPSMIEQSQTARMYGIYVICIMLFGIALFRWERTESTSAFLLSVAAALLAISFHSLAVFSIPLFFFPGLMKQSWRMLILGAIAFAGCLVIERQLNEWIGSHYFPLVERSSPASGEVEGMLARPIDLGWLAAGVLGVVLATGASLLFARSRKLSTLDTAWLVAAVACLAGAVALALLVQYHLAGIMFLVGTIFFVRAGFSVWVPAALGGLLATLLGVHAWLMWQSPDVRSINDLVEILAGTPYPKTYLSFSGFSPLGIVIYSAVFSYFAVQFARGRPLPDHVLFFLIAVFAPLFLMGFLAGQYIPGRYVIGFLPLFLLALVAGITDLINRYGDRLPGNTRAVGGVFALVVLLVFVSPADFWYNINPKHEDFPRLTGRGVDHKGAAEFVLEQNLDEDDVVISMDTQQQVYYLEERVDYYMRSLTSGRNSSFMRDGRMLCLYTGRPQISTGAELADLLSEPVDREILIVGSGEIVANNFRGMSDGIPETMEAFDVEEVFLGRDGATRVWRYVSEAGPLVPAVRQ
jgi:hypothetical protein